MLVENRYNDDNLISVLGKQDLNNEADFISVLKPHIEYTQVTPVEALMYKGDFYGLLKHIGISNRLLYITTRLNELNGSQEYDGENNVISFVDSETAERVLLFI